MSEHRTKRDRQDPLGDVAFLAGLTRRERAGLLSLRTSVEARPGQTIIEQGTVGQEFFIIVEGTAAVTRDGRPVAALGPGDHFGELALLGDHALRTATVTAISSMRLEVLTYPELMAMLDRAPAIARRLLRQMAQYHAIPPSGGAGPGLVSGVHDEERVLRDRA